VDTKRGSSRYSKVFPSQPTIVAPSRSSAIVVVEETGDKSSSGRGNFYYAGGNCIPISDRLDHFLWLDAYEQPHVTSTRCVDYICSGVNIPLEATWSLFLSLPLFGQSQRSHHVGQSLVIVPVIHSPWNTTLNRSLEVIRHTRRGQKSLPARQRGRSPQS
jgi:hypothetical protein